MRGLRLGSPGGAVRVRGGVPAVKHEPIPPRAEILPRRGLRREAAAGYVGVSVSKFDQWVSDGRMPKPKRIDGVVVWDVRALDLAFDALGDDDGSPNEWD